MKIKIFALLVLSSCFAIGMVEMPKGFKTQALEPLGGELLMPESWHFHGGMTQTGFLFIASKEKNAGGSYDTGFKIQGIVGIKKKTGVSAKEAAQKNLNLFEKNAKKVIRTWPELEFGYFRRIGIEVLQANAKNPDDEYHVIYSFFWNDDMDMMVASVSGAPESNWPEADKVFEVMQRFKLVDVDKLKGKTDQDSAPAETPGSKEAKGFGIGSINLGYMSQDEFAQRVSTDEIVAYIDRVKIKCGSIFAEDKDPKQFYIILVVHSGHSHVWVVDANGKAVPGLKDLEQQLQKLTLPRLKSGPLAFAIDARIAGGKPAEGRKNSAPVVPDEWRKALQNNKAAESMHFDDVIRLVCDK
ncbi:MAG: hypothetical protein QM715_05395 [Nibricoccus sp.]